MRSHTLAVIAVILLSAPLVSAEDESNIQNQQKEMERIQDEVTRTKHKLDSLRRVEIDLRGRISENDEKIASNRKVITRLSRQKGRLERQIKESEAEMVQRQDQLEYTRRRYLGNVRQFYIAAHNPEIALPDQPNRELEVNRQIVYLASLANFESGTVADAGSYLDAAIDHMDELVGENRKIAKLKRSKETSSALELSRKRKKEKDLQKLQRRKAAESDRILTLEQAAREIERIIVRLEQERRNNQPTGSDQPSVFATLQGKYRAPCRGKIIVPFGRQVDPVTNLKSFSPGISIEGRPGRAVMAIAGGEVAYVGTLRGYGKFVIINHDSQYYTTYAGLGAPIVSNGQFVATGEKLGTAGNDGIVKFELRLGREPHDPVKWIKIDSF